MIKRESGLSPELQDTIDDLERRIKDLEDGRVIHEVATCHADYYSSGFTVFTAGELNRVWLFPIPFHGRFNLKRIAFSFSGTVTNGVDALFALYKLDHSHRLKKSRGFGKNNAIAQVSRPEVDENLKWGVRHNNPQFNPLPKFRRITVFGGETALSGGAQVDAVIDLERDLVLDSRNGCYYVGIQANHQDLTFYFGQDSNPIAPTGIRTLPAGDSFGDFPAELTFTDGNVSVPYIRLRSDIGARISPTLVEMNP